jgi:hypothetical protein
MLEIYYFCRGPCTRRHQSPLARCRVGTCLGFGPCHVANTLVVQRVICTHIVVVTTPDHARVFLDIPAIETCHQRAACSPTWLDSPVKWTRVAVADRRGGPRGPLQHWYHGVNGGTVAMMLPRRRWAGSAFLSSHFNHAGRLSSGGSHQILACCDRLRRCIGQADMGIVCSRRCSRTGRAG